MAGVVVVLAQTSKRTDAGPASQSAKQVRGASPCVEIKNEPAPKLTVDPPLVLEHGSVQWIIAKDVTTPNFI